MEKTSTPVRWWDWTAIILLFFLLQTLASRLVATTWTSDLYLAQTACYIGYALGIALGYSTFSPRITRWLNLGYMIMMLPLQWTLMIDQNASLEEQLSSVAGRLFYSTSDFLARRPVEDPLFFVVIMTFTFWIISSSAAFTLLRKQHYLGAVIPSAIGILIIQNYDRVATGRLWFIAFFALMALLLLGRLHFLQNRDAWRKRRVFLSPDNSLELTSSMTIAAALLILVSWTVPASLAAWNSAIERWEKITQPWRDFSERMENAVSALESPSGGRSGEFFSSELPLGRGFPISDVVMFQVQAPELPVDQEPPRYYWRGRTYDTFVDGQWYTTGTLREEYSPATVNPLNLAVQEKPLARFIFNTADPVSLLYSPAQPVWVSRPGITFSQPSETARDIVAWHAYPSLRAGETYQVDAALSNPNLQQLRDAGTNYPDWVTAKYLQLPENFSPRIRQLADVITVNAETPFDKASAITRYLRSNIEYTSSIPNPPRNRDVLEWVLLDYKKGYCVYYASAEVVMLRSLGIPARMAAGFAEGERADDENTYVVRRLNAHAWPEVYFPNIGWVEFEPTGNQPTLDRPLPSLDPEDSDAIGPAASIQTDDSVLGDRNSDIEDVTLTDPGAVPVSPLWYVIPFVIIAAVLTFFINRRYPLATRVPGLVRASFERTGFEVPRWIYNWEAWGYLSPIEKAFESINFGLRILGQEVPGHTTPAERAKKLMGIVPNLSTQIRILLDEHQTSLYTSRVADVIQARQAAFNIRKEVLLERLRYLFSGKPLHN